MRLWLHRTPWTRHSEKYQSPQKFWKTRNVYSTETKKEKSDIVRKNKHTRVIIDFHQPQLNPVVPPGLGFSMQCRWQTTTSPCVCRTFVRLWHPLLSPPICFLFWVAAAAFHWPGMSSLWFCLVGILARNDTFHANSTHYSHNDTVVFLVKFFTNPLAQFPIWKLEVVTGITFVIH